MPWLHMDEPRQKLSVLHCLVICTAKYLGHAIHDLTKDLKFVQEGRPVIDGGLYCVQSRCAPFYSVIE